MTNRSRTAHHHPWLHPAAALLLLLGTGLMLTVPCARAAEAVGANPAPAQGSALPEDEYVKRLNGILSGIDLAELPRSGPPAGGLEVYAVVPGLQAARAGLAVGDQVVDLDGHEARTVDAFAALRRDRLQPMTVWSPGKGRRAVSLEPGRIGVSFAPALWHAEVDYLASAGRVPAADRAMVAAGLALHADPELALAALAHAQAQGFHGSLALAMQACACYELGRYSEATTAAEAALRAQPGSPVRELRAALYGSSFLLGKMAEAQATSARFPDQEPGEGGEPAAFAPYLAEVAARRVGKAPPADPLEAISGAHAGFDLTGLMHCMFRTGEMDNTRIMKKVAAGTDIFGADSPSSKGPYFIEIALPQVDVLEFQLTFTFKSHEPANPNACLAWSIGDPDAPMNKNNGGCDILQMDFTQRVTGQQLSIVGVRGLPMARVPIAHHDPGADTYRLLLARADGMVGTEFDGVRLDNLPVLGQAGRKSLYLYICGGTMTLKGMRLVAHDAKPPAGSTPMGRGPGGAQPSAPAPPDRPKGANDF